MIWMLRLVEWIMGWGMKMIQKWKMNKIHQVGNFWWWSFERIEIMTESTLSNHIIGKIFVPGVYLNTVTVLMPFLHQSKACELENFETICLDTDTLKDNKPGHFMSSFKEKRDESLKLFMFKSWVHDISSVGSFFSTL